MNDDLAAGINKAISVNGDEPTNADVVGGALTAGKPAVPWAIFRQQETNGSPPPNDQAFVRSFANGAWTTRGNGTVGGRSSTSPTFRGSLNLDQRQDAEAPAIDFAGTGRTVPWATWYEDTTGTGFAQVGSNHVTLTAGQSHTVTVALNHAGTHLLAKRHHLVATLQVLQSLPGGHVATVSTQTVTFKTPRHKRHKH